MNNGGGRYENVNMHSEYYYNKVKYPIKYCKFKITGGVPASPTLKILANLVVMHRAYVQTFNLC